MDTKPWENLKDLNRRDNIVVEKVLKLKSAKKIFKKDIASMKSKQAFQWGKNRYSETKTSCKLKIKKEEV